MDKDLLVYSHAGDKSKALIATTNGEEEIDHCENPLSVAIDDSVMNVCPFASDIYFADLLSMPRWNLLVSRFQI